MTFYLHKIPVRTGSIFLDQNGVEWECTQLERVDYAGMWPYRFCRKTDGIEFWFDTNGQADADFDAILQPPKANRKPFGLTPTEIELANLKDRMTKLETLKGYEQEEKKSSVALKELRGKIAALKIELYPGKKRK